MLPKFASCFATPGIQGVPEYSHHSLVQVPASRGADRPHGGGDLGLPRDSDQGADGPAAVDRLYFNDEEIDCISSTLCMLTHVSQQKLVHMGQ